jgi:hypothetical protein
VCDLKSEVLVGFWYVVYNKMMMGYLEKEDREKWLWAFVSYHLDTRFSHAWETIVGYAFMTTTLALRIEGYSYS